MNKNISVSFKILALILSFATIFSLVGCKSDKESELIDNSNTTELNSENDKQNENNPWELTINNKPISFPCSLDKLNEVGITIKDTEKLEQIITTPGISNRSFIANCGDNSGLLFIYISTGTNPELGEENVFVTGIQNIISANNSFKIKNNIKIGSSIEDIISTFGKDYETLDNSKDVPEAFMIYNFNNSRIHFSIENNKVSAIEICQLS